MHDNEIKHSFILDGFEVMGYDNEAIVPAYTFNAGRSKFIFPKTLKLSSKIRIRFKKPSSFMFRTPLIVDKDDNIYLSVSDDNELCQPDGYILKVSLDGQIHTVITFKNRECEYIILGKNQEIYCLSGRNTFEREDCYLHCFNLNGELKWELSTGVNAHEPILDNDGNIYVIYDEVNGFDRHTVLLSLNCSGQERWNYHFPCLVRKGPIISVATGMIYVSCSGVIYCFDKEGNVVWTTKYSNSHDFFPVIKEDGTLIYVTDRDIYSIDKTGNLLWTSHFDDFIKLQPVYDSKGNIYISSPDDRLISYTENGEVRWNQRLINGHIGFPLIIDRNNNILVQTVGSNRNNTCNFEIYSSEGERLQTYTSRGEMNSTVLLGEGKLCTLLYYPHAGGKKNPNFNNSAMEIQIIMHE